MNPKQVANLLIVGCVIALLWVLWPKAPSPSPIPTVSPVDRTAQTENQQAENPPPQVPPSAAADDAAARVTAEATKIIAAQNFVQGTLKLALSRYKIDMGDFPSTADGLQALLTPPSGAANIRSWHGPYVSEDPAIPLDPWGRAYLYAYPSTHVPAGIVTFAAWSGGPAADGTTDIGNW